MSSLKVEKINKTEHELKYKVSYGEIILAIFTEEHPANEFINSELCKMLVDHITNDK
jgi:hypothetical protein